MDKPLLTKHGKPDGRSLRPKNYPALLQIRVDEDLKTGISRVSRKQKISPSQFVRNAVQDAIQNHDSQR